MVLLTPNTAIAEVRNSADARVQRNALPAVGLVFALLTRCIADFDIGQQKIISVEQLGHFGGGQQGFGFGAAVSRWP